LVILLTKDTLRDVFKISIHSRTIVIMSHTFKDQNKRLNRISNLERTPLWILPVYHTLLAEGRGRHNTFKKYKILGFLSKKINK